MMFVLRKFKQLEMNGYVINTVVTAVMVLKHQAISIKNADEKFIAMDQFDTNIYS